MKVNHRFNPSFIVLVVLLLPLSFRGVVNGSRIFDFLFGENESEEGQEEMFLGFVDQVNDYYREHVGGDSVSRSVSPVVSRGQGKRALGCVSYIGGVEWTKWIKNLNPLAWIFVYERYYEAFPSQAKIDMVCNFADYLKEYRSNITRRNRNLVEEELPTTTTIDGEYDGVRRRPYWSRQATEPQYPAEVSMGYANWARNRVRRFITAEDDDGERDLTSRTDILVYIDNDFGTAETLTVVIRTLSGVRGFFSVICRIFGIGEFVFDPGDFCNIITETVDLAREATILARQGITADSRYTIIHDNYIDSVEIEAINSNIASLF